MSRKLNTVVSTALLTIALQPATSISAVLTLKNAEQQALNTDPRLASGVADIESAQADYDAAGQLPDPKLKLAAMNIPVDTFNLDQEAMTNIQVGIQQRIPAGSTLKLEKTTSHIQTELRKYQFHGVKKTVLKELRNEWLEIWAGQARSDLLKQQQQVLDSLLPSVKGAYRAGRGKQSDVSRIRLRISQLENEYYQIRGEQQVGLAGIGRWGVGMGSQLPEELPESLQSLPIGQIDNHPELAGIRSLTEISRYQIELAEQRYKPEWGIEASYGWRDERDDLVSLGVSISLPLFAVKSLDASLAARQKTYQAARELVRNSRLELETEVNRLQSKHHTLTRRINSYQDDVLPELGILQTLSRSEYRSGRSDFTRMLDAEEAVIEAQRTLLNLSIEMAKNIIALRFLLEETQL